MKQTKAARTTILEDEQGKGPLQIKKKSTKITNVAKVSNQASDSHKYNICLLNTNNGRGPRNVTKITKVINQGIYPNRHKNNNYLRRRRKNGAPKMYQN